MRRGNRVQRWPKTFIALAVLLLGPVGAALSSTDSVAVYTPAFSSQGTLGELDSRLGVNAAAFLNLQLWRTLLVPINPDGSQNWASKGILWWDDLGRPIDSHATAERQARDSLVQMTYWGQAFEYGDGVVIQSYLSLPRYNDFRTDYNERWSLTVRGVPIEVDMPRRRYDFSPILLGKDAIAQYTSPFAFDFCPDDGGACYKIASGGYRAIAHNPDCTDVQLLDSGKRGKICGVIASEGKPEVVDFIAGIVRIMRADWGRAADSFQAVVDNPDADVRLQVGARMLQARSLAQTGAHDEAIAAAQAAWERSPIGRSALKYLVMAKMFAWGETVTKARIMEIRNLIDANRVLFSPKDPWLGALEKILSGAQ
jgi:hypothetical protein